MYATAGSMHSTLLVAVMSSMVNTQAFASPTSKFLSTSGLLISPVHTKKIYREVLEVF